MNAGKNILIFAGALLAVAAGVLAWNQHLENIALRAQLLDPDNRADLQKQLAAATDRIKSLEAQIAVLQERLAAQTAREADQAGQKSSAAVDNAVVNQAVSGPAPGNSAGQQPLTPAQVQQYIQAAVQAHLPLFKALNLSPEQTEQFTNLLTQKQEAAFSAANDALQQGASPAAAMQMVASAQGAANAQIQTQFGDAVYAQYQQYEQTFPQRNTIGHLAQFLSGTDTPLTDDQANQMVQLLAQTQMPDDGGSLLRHINGSINFHARISDQTVSQAAGLLSPPQLQALQALQQNMGAPVANP